MRTFAIVSALGAVAVTLHGCGGGGGSPSPGPSPPAAQCSNPKVDFVTQSMVGTSSGSLSLALDIKGLPGPIAPIMAKPIDMTTSGTYTLKFDLEKFNVRLDTKETLTVKPEGLPLTIKADVNLKVIFDPTTKELALDTNLTLNLGIGEPINVKNCSVLTINEIPPLKNITDTFNQIKTAVQSLIECQGNDGKNDDWRTKALPDPVSKYLTASIDLYMDKDYLLREIDMDLTKFDEEIPIPLPPMPFGNLTINSVKANGNLKVKVDTVTKDAPSDKDLDYKGFGDTCTKLPPVAFKDVKNLLIAHRMRPQAIAAVYAAAANAQKTKTVTV